MTSEEKADLSLLMIIWVALFTYFVITMFYVFQFYYFVFMEKHVFELITRDNCAYCIESKKLLEVNGKNYRELVIGRDISREEVMSKYPDRKVLPIVIQDGKVIGGYQELLDLIFPPLAETEND